MKIVAGLIVFKGRIELHSLGARAEEAQIIQLAAINGQDLGIKERAEALNLKIDQKTIDHLESKYRVRLTDLKALEKRGQDLAEDPRFLNSKSLNNYLPKTMTPQSEGILVWRNFVIVPTLLFLIANSILQIAENMGLSKMLYTIPFGLEPAEIGPLGPDQTLIVAAIIFVIGVIIASAQMIFKALKRAP
jgi:hypothetical protein